MAAYRTDMINTVISRSSFGIWDLLNAGSDPFGAPTRAKLSAEECIALLGRLNVPRISLHDLDVGLDPWVTPDEGALNARKDVLKNALKAAGVQVWMYTPCLFHNPLVRAGSFTNNDARVRNASLRKALYALDVAEDFGASWLTFWLGRDGAEVDALIDSTSAYQRIAYALQIACDYIRHKGYKVRISLEPKPNEPRGDIFISTVGTALGIISMLPEEDQKLVGVNPELLQHEGMAGLNAYHAIGQLVAADKLAFLHLGGQTPLRYDMDHPFLGGNSGLKESFYIALAVAKHGQDCILEFDCHPFRTEANEDAREEFVLGNLEAAGMMMDKAHSFLAIPEVQELLADTDSRDFGVSVDPAQDFAGFLKALHADKVDAAALSAAQNPRAMTLDRLVNKHLLGYL
ncbi:MAG: TIM barrel protein [Armatimonadota bacterium]